MKPGRSLTTLFLLPALLVLAPALLLAYVAMSGLQGQIGQNHSRQVADLTTLQQAAEYERALAELHAQVIETLDLAHAGELDALARYRRHSAFVNALAELGQQVTELSESALLVDLNHGSAAAMLEAFGEYRRFIIMASDSATIDANTAQHYMLEAQGQFIRFSSLTHHFSAALAERAAQRSGDSHAAQIRYFNRLGVYSGAALLLLLGVATLSARRLNRDLLTLANAIVGLAKKRDNMPELASLQALANDTRGELHPIATALLELRESEKQRQEAEESLHRLTYFDSLTTLPNWRMMDEQLGHALQLSNRTQAFGALIYLDLDLFQSVNDSYGHGTGDRLLREVAQRLEAHKLEGCTVGRLGGDEFMLILDSLSTDDKQAATVAEAFADRLRQSLAQPFSIDDKQIFISASQGVAMFRGEENSTETLFKYADAACHQAKAAGRNAILFYDPDVQASLEYRNELKRDLRLALERNEFLVVYQLQFDTEGHPIGAEALVRWQHPGRGLVSPADFIPLAEESGLIVPLGYQVMESACRQLALWQQAPGTAHLTLAVNVSARQFYQGDLVEQIKRILAMTGASARQLKLELTESTLLDKMDEVVATMHQLKMLGLRFAIDDFGTGYSSLQYLKRLPLDQIKIDQSFVNDFAQNPDGMAIVRAIIAMGLALQLDVIAEGVETQEQWQLLIQHGCHAFQGYLFCRPLPADQLDAFLTPAPLA